ncbi:MAG: FAD-dependent thymidylate synthase [Candidatus Omnitrophica bacterium]|nr:FAD-dependent thymidylate synthase [Candidatus Omnitrophota bacterium]
MKVNLAGFNVDTKVLEDLQRQATVKREDLTPEVISAAYARISRDPRPIDQIRQDARNEVERARRSNSTIIFKMGHHSIAEHAVFNLDIIGVSRYAMEEVERFRLCSYTEKSQRYITLDKGFIVPQELEGTKYKKFFVDVIEDQNYAYVEFFNFLKDYVFSKYNDLASDRKNYELLEGWAKEDARYITSLSTLSQVGLTINARNLEFMLRRFASSRLSEVQVLGEEIYKKVFKIAPSLLIFHQANDYDRKTYLELAKLSKTIFSQFKNLQTEKKKYSGEDVYLVEATKNGDLIVTAAILHTVTNLSYQICKEIVSKLSKKQLFEIFKNSWKYMEFYDAVLREFEYVNFVFNIVLSAACFAQLKRHRMATLTAQNYDPSLGVTIPPSIKAIGKEKQFIKIIEKTNKVYKILKKNIPIVAPYVLTNAHRKRVLLAVNARELYHISRLREDEHAQWDIRNIVGKMSKLAKNKMPFVCAIIGGKDKYNQLYNDIFGKLPKVTTQTLPGVRKIKLLK